MIVSAHQPNFLPGASVLTKAAASDAVIWVDEVQFSHFSFTARNRMPDGSWLSLPVKSKTRMGAINRVELDRTARRLEKVARTLEHCYAGAAERYAAEVRRPYGLLVGLNTQLLRLLCEDLEIGAQWHWQSQLLAGRPLEHIVDDRPESGLRRQISSQLARMCAEVGGDIYLSGPSGMNYLDEEPFRELEIEVRYWRHEGANPCGLQLVRDRMQGRAAA